MPAPRGAGGRQAETVSAAIGVADTLAAPTVSGAAGIAEIAPARPLAVDRGADATITGDASGVAPRKVAAGPTADENENETEPSEPPRLPLELRERFDSFRFLGRGGMGTVYKARDRRVERYVALKFLTGTSPDAGFLLLREARAQARLEHENVCKVYEVGAAEGQRYIVMQFIDGAPFDKAKDGMTLEERVRVVLQVASALHEAHRLGLVHRDVKPSNIMVEQAEDGAYKPFLMDFGLAREVGLAGQTMTGAIAGTPAFMAPEQALGQIRALDRRTDVYSLGATLYDVLAGRPPFTADSLPALFDLITREDPPPLRKIRQEVPVDLEAIVMKCLEKEPNRRYDSARALHEDLQRFLDGEPVKARRASLGYVLRKKVKRHKLRVALAAAALVAAVIVLTLWVRGRRIAAEEASLARELGEDVKEMELFLRNAYGLPLHDIERQKDLVRERLRAVEARMAAAGRVGEGPGHYALGRGYLALQEPESALAHLRRADAAGYSAHGLRYATGLALGELYREALDQTKRIRNPEQKKTRLSAIEAEYKRPALDHLRAALEARLDAPAYVEGLLALYEGRHEEALAKAREAFEKAPWLYEAKKLEGDAYFAEGSRWRHDAAFDYARMIVPFNQAAEAYQAASTIARSDPKVYEAECELWIQHILSSHVRPETLVPSFEKARRACESAVAASPRSSEALVKTAFAYQTFAWQMTAGMPEKGSPEKAVVEAIERSEEAARHGPKDPMAHYVVGASWRANLLYVLNTASKAHAGEAAERAIAGYEEALRLDPTFLWACNGLCSLYGMKTRIDVWQGLDPEASARKAVVYCDRAMEIDPSFTNALVYKADAHLMVAARLVETGRSPEGAVKIMLDASAAARERSPDSMGARFQWAFAHQLTAAFEVASGGDPRGALALATEGWEGLEKLSPSSDIGNELLGRIESTRALYRMREGEDPGAALEKARAAFQHLTGAAPWDVSYRVLLTEAELIGLRWALREREAREAQFDAALKPLLSLLDTERGDPRVYQELAAIYEFKARWRVAGRKGVEEEVSRGLEMAGKALALNPRMAAALGVKAGLHVLRAQGARAPEVRAEEARRAKEALAEALRENPLLERELRSTREEIERLLGGGSGQ